MKKIQRVELVTDKGQVNLEGEDAALMAVLQAWLAAPASPSVRVPNGHAVKTSGAKLSDDERNERLNGNHSRGKRRGGMLALLRWMMEGHDHISNAEITLFARKWGVRGPSGVAGSAAKSGYLQRVGMRENAVYSLTKKGRERAADDRLIAQGARR